MLLASLTWQDFPDILPNISRHICEVSEIWALRTSGRTHAGRFICTVGEVSGLRCRPIVGNEMAEEAGPWECR